MPRTAKHTNFSHSLHSEPHHLPRLSPSSSLSKPQRPKSKSLQPCRCSHEGCGKMFSKRSNLKAHMRVHSGVLPYPCHFPGCTKRFRWKSSLKPHIRVHLASGHIPPPSSSSNTNNAISSTQSTNTHNQLNFTLNLHQRLEPEPVSRPAFTGKVLDLHANLPLLSSTDESGGQSPTSITVQDAPGMADDRDIRKETRHRTDPALLHPPNKPPVVRVLFQDSHVQQDFDDHEEIDLSTDSVLSNSVASNETDGFSFTLGSPVENSHNSNEKNLTEQLWKTDIQVLDPFEDLPIDDVDSNLALLSGLDGSTGISANSTEPHVSDSQWMFPTGESTVSSADLTTTLHSLSM